MISLLSLSAQFSASFMSAVIFSMPCKYSSGHSTPVSVGRDLSLTHRSNIPGKFANHQVVGKLVFPMLSMGYGEREHKP